MDCFYLVDLCIYEELVMKEYKELAIIVVTTCIVMGILAIVLVH